MRKWRKLVLSAVLSVMAYGAGVGAAASRAAWWLARDGVEPVADLVNAAAPGTSPRFRDRVGSFRVRTDGRALIVAGRFPKAAIWRFDLSTFDGRFDMRRLYVEYGHCAYPNAESIQTRRLAKLLGDPKKALTRTGPWDIFNGDWKVPTARVALDGRHVYTSWFDLPSLADQAAGRVYASFALEIAEPGEHTVRISFDDFARHTRWRPSRRGTPPRRSGFAPGAGPTRPEVTYVRNPLRPGHVGSIAVGIDERTRRLKDVPLKPKLVGKHPRLGGEIGPAKTDKPLGLSDKPVQDLIRFLDPDRGELWEYSDDAESMASGNDMDAGRKGLAACRTYDRLVPRLTPQARKEVDRAFLKRFGGIYTFFVFQRNYLPTGYAQNHCSKSVWALVGAGLAWDGPEARKWRAMAAMVCRKRVELLGRDGGLEWMNESRSYGLGFWETARGLFRQCTGADLARGEFFRNEWRYALHNAPAFPASRVPVLITHHGVRAKGNLPLPAGVTPQNTPTSFHFSDCDQVFLRTGWGDDALRLRFLVGSAFGRAGTPRALRYNWAHCQVNRGSISIHKGLVPILNEPGWDRTYRKSAANNNCILVNDTDQWGGGQVWHPRLRADQVGRVAFYADGALMAVARADLKNAYPPEARIRSLSRTLVQLKPDHFLVFDRLVTEGRGKGEWRFHAAFLERAGAAGRCTAYGFRPNQRKPASFEQAFAKVPEASCEVAFLSPPVRARIGLSDVYFRGHAFRKPTRHLRVIQESDAPMTLLTALAPKVLLTPNRKNAFVAPRGDVSWVVLVGGGAAEGLASDAHLAVAAYDIRTKTAEVARFGGTHLAFRGLAVPSKAEDLFAVLRGGKVVKVVRTR